MLPGADRLHIFLCNADLASGAMQGGRARRVAERLCRDIWVADKIVRALSGTDCRQHEHRMETGQRWLDPALENASATGFHWLRSEAVWWRANDRF